MTRACKVSAQFLGHWWANVSQSVLNSLDQNKYQNMDSSVLFSCYLSMTSDLSFFIFNSEQCSSFFFFFLYVQHHCLMHICVFLVSQSWEKSLKYLGK